jgi:hypothetical protein
MNNFCILAFKQELKKLEKELIHDQEDLIKQTISKHGAAGSREKIYQEKYYQYNKPMSLVEILKNSSTPLTVKLGQKNWLKQVFMI